jgi:hypothetical protein
MSLPGESGNGSSEPEADLIILAVSRRCQLDSTTVRWFPPRWTNAILSISRGRSI